MDSILDLYRSKDVVSEDGTGLPLHVCCPNAVNCWRDIEKRAPSGEQGHVSLPWIGSRYAEGRLLAVGENLNEGGGLHALDGLVAAARVELNERMRVRFGLDFKKYRGSLIWHHVGAYAATILRLRNVEPFGSATWNANDGVPRALAIEAYAFLAYTNHVKCSPTADLSRPSATMWDICGREILRHEIAILEPTTILALGSTNNGWRVRQKALVGWEEVSAYVEGHVHRHVLRDGDRRVEVITVPHPSARGVSWKRVCADIAASDAA